MPEQGYVRDAASLRSNNFSARKLLVSLPPDGIILCFFSSSYLDDASGVDSKDDEDARRQMAQPRDLKA